FYKLGAGESDDKRRSTLNIAWRQLRNTGAQYYLIGPNIDSLDSGVGDEFESVLTVSSFNTVVVDVEDRSEIDDPVRDIQEFLRYRSDGPSLIFVSAPKRAGELAVQLVA